MFGSLWGNRRLVLQMARRDLVERYRGSVFGFLWSLFNPILMLAVFTFVFTVVFRARWPATGGTNAEFAVNAFVGLIVYGLFAESVGRAPSLVLQNAHLVKKVVFPLEVLPWVSMASSVFHAAVSFVVLVAFTVVVTGAPRATSLLLPLVVVPVILLSLGLSWFLASIGVFLRDASHTVPLLITALMFVSPIFYPLSSVPENVRWILALNPLAGAMEDSRAVALGGVIPDPTGYILLLVGSAAVAWGGLWWFMRTKHTFADVL